VAGQPVGVDAGGDGFAFAPAIVQIRQRMGHVPVERRQRVRQGLACARIGPGEVVGHGGVLFPHPGPKLPQLQQLRPGHLLASAAVVAEAHHFHAQKMAVAGALRLRFDRGRDVLDDVAAPVDDEMGRCVARLKIGFETIGGASAGGDVDGQPADRPHLRRMGVVADGAGQRHGGDRCLVDEGPLRRIAAA